MHIHPREILAHFWLRSHKTYGDSFRYINPRVRALDSQNTQYLVSDEKLAFVNNNR